MPGQPGRLCACKGTARRFVPSYRNCTLLHSPRPQSAAKSPAPRRNFYPALGYFCYYTARSGYWDQALSRPLAVARALKQPRSWACPPISIQITTTSCIRISSRFWRSMQAASRRSGRASPGQRSQFVSFYIGCVCLLSLAGIIGTSRIEPTRQAGYFNSSLRSSRKAPLKKACCGGPRNIDIIICIRIPSGMCIHPGTRASCTVMSAGFSIDGTTPPTW